MIRPAAHLRRPRGGTSLALLALVAVTVACADDGNDARPAPSPVTAGSTTTVPTSMAQPGVTTTVPSTAPEVRPTGVVVEVRALDNSFRPEVIEVSVGDEVVWINAGRNEHDALSVEGDDWGVEVEQFQPGDTYAHVFTEPGEYRYYCSIHGTTEVGMVGTVIVSS